MHLADHGRLPDWKWTNMSAIYISRLMAENLTEQRRTAKDAHHKNEHVRDNVSYGRRVFV